MDGFVVLIIIFSIGGVIYAIWKWNDAKDKGINPWVAVNMDDYSYLALRKVKEEINTMSNTMSKPVSPIKTGDGRVQCPRCGSVQSNDRSFCNKCGVSFPPPTKPIAKKVEQQVAESADRTSVKSEVDEILRYKELLDKEIITKEEFEAKKKQLLGL